MANKTKGSRLGEQADTAASWLLGELGVQRTEGRGQKPCFQVLSAPVPTSKPAAQEYSARLHTNTRAFTSIVH